MRRRRAFSRRRNRLVPRSRIARRQMIGQKRATSRQKRFLNRARRPMKKVLYVDRSPNFLGDEAWTTVKNILWTRPYLGNPGGNPANNSYYQGGAIPGNWLPSINIPDLDMFTSRFNNCVVTRSTVVVEFFNMSDSFMKTVGIWRCPRNLDITVAGQTPSWDGNTVPPEQPHVVSKQIPPLQRVVKLSASAKYGDYLSNSLYHTNGSDVLSSPFTTRPGTFFYWYVFQGHGTGEIDSLPSAPATPSSLAGVTMKVTTYYRLKFFNPQVEVL